MATFSTGIDSESFSVSLTMTSQLEHHDFSDAKPNYSSSSVKTKLKKKMIFHIAMDSSILCFP